MNLVLGDTVEEVPGSATGTIIIHYHHYHYHHYHY